MAFRKVAGLVLAVVLVFSLASAAPARLIALLAPIDRVIMQGFDGTLWRGSASRVLVRVGPGYLHLGAVEWALRPLSLLTFRPRLDLRSRWGRQQVSGELVLRGDSDLSLHELSANLPAEPVRHFLPVVLEGDLSFQFATLHLREGLPYQTDGRLVWRDAAWMSPAGIRPLGSYAVELRQPAGATLAGQVITLSGPVDAAGSLQLSGRDYSVDIVVGDAESLDNQLRQALSLVASPEGGRYRVKLEGQL